MSCTSDTERTGPPGPSWDTGASSSGFAREVLRNAWRLKLSPWVFVKELVLQVELRLKSWLDERQFNRRRARQRDSNPESDDHD